MRRHNNWRNAYPPAGHRDAGIKNGIATGVPACTCGNATSGDRSTRGVDPCGRIHGPDSRYILLQARSGVRNSNPDPAANP
ncbi:hypothetical protein TVNIR_2735 [Thioalkalivibrio nitratireducens DSM 14787]|uniref:Uncharacterized protein n=1 Tax=Thioalkalivibrio nitratireducens (strain DSM 14787 / UNIQEM 213 / ALEN2) TaxID=1255043 RepID=L0DZB8_THIND|nr:hypothetical protein TVNIR_2735 [Thioalkalivibrio nitratireducens DSM 14787]